jgi:prepilin peptidase CpaA
MGALWDVRFRRIPNGVTLLALVAGIAWAWSRDGVIGGLTALGAAMVVVALLWLPWVTGRLGGGDVKLGAAAATVVGMGGLTRFLLASALAGGLVALVAYFRSSRKARSEMRTNLTLAVAGQPLDLPARPSTPGRVSVPYGVAFVVGAFVALAGGGL